MQRTDEIVKMIRGRQCTRRVDISAWRKKMKTYREYKADILAKLAATGWDNEQIAAWLNQPLPGYEGRTPKQMIHPDRIKSFYERWFCQGNKLTGINPV